MLDKKDIAYTYALKSVFTMRIRGIERASKTGQRGKNAVRRHAHGHLSFGETKNCSAIMNNFCGARARAVFCRIICIEAASEC